MVTETTLRETAKRLQNQPSSEFLHLAPPPGELEEVQMLDAWGEDDIDVGKVAS